MENGYQRFSLPAGSVIVQEVSYVILMELTRRITVSGGVVISSKN